MKITHTYVKQVILLCFAGLLCPFLSAQPLPVFPGAEGYGTETVAGRGTVGVAGSTTVYVVTSLGDSAPAVSGELRYGIENVSGPRVIVFEVGGVIELRKVLTVRQSHPYLTIAGQTAPYPGITLKNAGINVQSHDVLVQHIAIRPGARPKGDPESGWNNWEFLPSYSNRKCIGIDVPSGYETYNVVFDHVTCSWGTDENVTIGGGSGTAVRDITISNSLISEALRFCGHPDVTDDEGNPDGIDGHSAGLYVYKLGEDVTVSRNIIAFNRWRNPKVAQGATDMHVINNFIYAPGQWQGHRIQVGESIPPHTTAYDVRSSIVGNVTVLHEDPTQFPSWSTTKYAANSTQAIDIHANAPVDVDTFLDNNHLWHPTYSGNWVPSSPDYNSTLVHQGTVPNQLGSDPLTDDGVTLLDSGWGPEEIEEYLLARSGSRPGDRDVVDLRLIAEIEERTLRDWMDLPSEYSASSGHDSDGYPTATGTHTLAIPAYATRQNDDDADGYTNLEEWLHSWSAQVESGGGAPADPSTTVLDNFEDGDAAGWTAAGSTSWSVVTSGGGDVYRQSDDSADARVILADSNWTNQVIQADIKITAVNGSSRWAGVFGRYTDINNHYYLLLRHGSNTLELRKKVGGALTTLDSASFTVSLNTTYTLRLKIDGTALTGYVNGVEQVSATDSALASGSVAVGMFKAEADVNNVYASSSPTPSYPLADDFQDGNANGWAAVGTTSWAVINNGSSYVYEQDNMTGGAASYAGSTSWTDQTIEMAIQITDTLDSTDRWAGPVARYTNDSNYYYMTLRENDTAELKKIQGGTVSVLDSISITFSHASVYDVKLEIIGETINGYIDGVLVLEAQDPGTSVTAGKAGVRMFKAAVEVDDVLVSTP